VQYRRMGKSGLKVSAICLGTMTYGQQIDEDKASELIKSAFDAGVIFFDTSDAYTDGRSEEILGKALKGVRHSVVLATKVRGRTGPDVNEIGLSRKHIMKAVEGSLSRLKTDYIDLYYAHAPDHCTPVEETLRAMDDLVHQGKVRYIGGSNYHAWNFCKSLWVSDLHNLARFECMQPPYNLITRYIEHELLPLCASEKVGVCVFNPLAGGLLTGKHDLRKQPAEGTRFSLGYLVQRGRVPVGSFGRSNQGAESTAPPELAGLGEIYYTRYWTEKNFEAVARLNQIAQENGRSLAQFALAWVLNNVTITSAITSATSLKQLEENVGAAEVNLSPEELAVADEVWYQLRPPFFDYGR